MAESSTADARRRAAIESFTPSDEVMAVVKAALDLLTPEEAFPGVRVFASARDASWYIARFQLPAGSVLYIPGEGKAFVRLAGGGIARPVDEAVRAAGGRYPGAFRVARSLADFGPVTGGLAPRGEHLASVPPGVAGRAVHRPSLTEAPDDARLAEQSREFVDLPGTSYCATLGGLRKMIEELNIRTSGNIGKDTTERQLGDAESAASAAQALGYRKVRFGLQVTDNQGKPAVDGVPQTHFKVVTEFRDPAWPVTKIGVGCVAAAHARHEGHSDGLRELGYRDVEDVAARARAYTARTGVRLPVPGEPAAPFRPGHDPALMPLLAVSFPRATAALPTTMIRTSALAAVRHCLHARHRKTR